MRFFPALRRASPALVCLLACGCTRTETAAAQPRLPRLLSTDFPLRLELADGELTLPAPPARLLPANAAWVDHVSLLVGPERVVALPSEAFGYSRVAARSDGWDRLPPLTAFEGERIVALAPDLVLAHAWQNPETLASLRRARIPVLVAPLPESWPDVLATLELLGAVLGVPQRAAELTDELETRRARLAERGQRFEHLRVLSYTNLGAGGWTTGARTTAATLLALAGLRNAAADAGLEGDVPADRERLLALAPDVFLVGRPDESESTPPSADFLLGDPDLRSLAAIRAHRIVSLPPALFSSASPELLTGAEAVLDELERLDREQPFGRPSSSDD